MHEHQASIIQSAGAPPERHADRVIAAMLRDLAKQRATIALAITEAINKSKDGGVRAQERMAERIRAAGAGHVELKPGTRGRYELVVQELIGWNPARDDAIGLHDPIPPKPWIALLATLITNRGRTNKSVPILFVTVHALSRAAQRFGLRTADEIITATYTICNAVFKAMEEMPTEKLFNPPPAGHRIPIKQTGIVVVLRKHETRGGLIATTMFWEGEQ